MFEENNFLNSFDMFSDFGDTISVKSNDMPVDPDFSLIFQKILPTFSEEDLSNDSLVHDLKINDDGMNHTISNFQDHLPTMKASSTSTSQNMQITSSPPHKPSQSSPPQKLIFKIVKIWKSMLRYDGIYKKIKVDYQKFLINELNTTIKESGIRRKNFRFGKLSQELVTNVTYKYNNELLTRELREIFKSDDGNKRDKHVNNKKIIKELEKRKNSLVKNKIRNLLNQTYAEVYDSFYLESKHYRKSLEDLQEEKDVDEVYFKTYVKVSKGFTGHFLKERKSKK